MDDKRLAEYFLLKNYVDQSLQTRGILGKMTLTYLEFVRMDAVPFVGKDGIKPIRFVEGEKEKVFSLLQIDFISKLFLYVEDLVIFAESFRQKRNFYDIVSSKDPKDDVGLLVESFLENAESYSFEDFLRVMSYVNPEDQKILDSEKILLKKIVSENISEMRRLFKEMYEFGKTHYIIYKRFKHAGFPIIFGLNSHTSPNFEEYDTYLAVLSGKDPLNDVQYFPYSEKVMRAYGIMFESLQSLLQDLVYCRIGSIERGLDSVYPHLTYSPDKWTQKEWKDYEQILKKFGEQNPFINIDRNIKLPPAKSEDLKWYLNLEKFLESAKKRQIESDEGQKRLVEDCMR